MTEQSPPTGSSPESTADATPETTFARPAENATAPKVPDSALLARTMQDMSDMLQGLGRHAGHVQTQVGRCVICSCSLRAQGVKATRRG